MVDQGKITETELALKLQIARLREELWEVRTALATLHHRDARRDTAVLEQELKERQEARWLQEQQKNASAAVPTESSKVASGSPA